MLEHLGLEEHGQRIRKAVDRVLAERRVMTPDLPGGRSGTQEMTQAIINALQEAPPLRAAL